MHLENSSGDSLKLDIAGYQFPHSDEDYDSNWLRIAGHVRLADKEWKFEDSCLLTYEAEKLANWIGRLRPSETEEYLEFLEPVLVFRKYKHSLRIYFEMESRPQWAENYEGNAADLWIDIPIDGFQFGVAARELRNQLGKYPKRAKV